MKARIPANNSIQESRRQTIEKLLGHPLSADDSFMFRCNQCGKCCKNRDDIILSAFDICRIAAHKSITPREVIDTYGFMYVGETSKIPLVILKMRSDNGECPFLHNNRCSIHLGKPAACALFPLGRFAARDKNGGVEISYILQPVDCGAKDEQHTPREWMSEFDLEESEEWFSVWQDTVMDISSRVIKLTEIIPRYKLNMTYHLMVDILYMRYDIDKPLIRQVESNKDYIMNILDILEGKL